MTPEEYDIIRKYLESLGISFDTEYDEMSDEYTHTFEFMLDAGLSFDMRLLSAPFSRFQIIPDADRHIIVYAN